MAAACKASYQLDQYLLIKSISSCKWRFRG